MEEETIGQRLTKARVAAGFTSRTKAAEFLGVPYPTYAGHENGSRNVDPQTADLYATKFNVSLEWLLTGRGVMNLAPELKRTDAQYPRIPVTGLAWAGSWRDVETVEGFAIDEYVPANPEYAVEHQFALRVDGQSLNRKARPGAVLICVDIVKAEIEIMDGDLVIAELSRYDGQELQITAKRARLTMHGYELWPESDDPAHQKPISLNNHKDHEQVRVLAKVVYIIDTQP